ncbi:MAG: sugar phosphate nucleotidyltransferase [Clostridiales bacterium]|nr:sugar phosphate nucleotidyltransferase [Clostridiales bacterium]
MKALVLAAGYATRMYPLNQIVHKALLPLGESTIMGQIIKLINAVPDCDEIIVISNHRFIPDFRAWQEGYQGRIPVVLIDDGTKTVEGRLGAIGDICYTIDQLQIDEDLLIIAGDTYFDFSLAGFLQSCKASGQDGVCVKRVEDRSMLHSLGVVLLDSDQRIVNIEEKPAEPKSDLAMYAIYYFTRDTVRLFAEYRKEGNPMDVPGSFIVWLYTKKPIITYAIEGQCHDVGTVEAYTSLCQSLGIAYPGLEGQEQG